MSERQHLVQSAGYWFNAARKYQLAGEMSEALFAMENAYNHVENALAAALKRQCDLPYAYRPLPVPSAEK
jgi:hypothetical protein